MNTTQLLQRVGLIEQMEGAPERVRAHELRSHIDFLLVGAFIMMGLYVFMRAQEVWKATASWPCAFSAMMHATLLMTPVALVALCVSAVTKYVTVAIPER